MAAAHAPWTTGHLSFARRSLQFLIRFSSLYSYFLILSLFRYVPLHVVTLYKSVFLYDYTFFLGIKKIFLNQRHQNIKFVGTPVAHAIESLFLSFRTAGAAPGLLSYLLLSSVEIFSRL